MMNNTQHLHWVWAGALFVLVLCALPISVHAATLFFSPSSGSYQTGAQFTVGVYVNSGGVAINAANGSVGASNLTLTSVSKASLFSLWPVEPSVAGNRVSFAGGLPSPGYNGTGGRIINISVIAGSPGTASLSLSGASVLANDGAGTNVLTGTGAATFTITEAPIAVPGAPSVSSPTHPDQETWYGNPNPEFTWNRGGTVDGFSYVLDQTADTTPDTVSEGNGTSTALTDLADGVWYFHIRAHTEAGWGPAAHFTVRIDNTPPSAPAITFEDDLPLTHSYTLVHILGDDAMSGIDHFDVFLDDGEVIVLSSEEAQSYLLQNLALGGHYLRVRAVDRAGKTAETTVAFSVQQAQGQTPCEVAECPTTPSALVSVAGVTMRLTTLAWLLTAFCLILLALLVFTLIRFKKETGSLRGLIASARKKKRKQS